MRSWCFNRDLMSQHTSETCKNKTHVGLWERIMSEQVSEHMQVVMSNKCPYIHTCQNMCVTTRARLQELMSQHMSEYMFTSSEHVSANIETHARLDVTTYVRMHSRTNVRLHRQSICQFCGMPEPIWEHVPDLISERVSEYMPEDMSEQVSKHTQALMSEHMSNYMPKRTSPFIVSTHVSSYVRTKVACQTMCQNTCETWCRSEHTPEYMPEHISDYIHVRTHARLHVSLSHVPQQILDCMVQSYVRPCQSLRQQMSQWQTCCNKCQDNLSRTCCPSVLGVTSCGGVVS